MKDQIKCRIVDVMLVGEPIFVVRRGKDLVMATVDNELFRWRGTGRKLAVIPTLKQALAIVDRHWETRVEEAA